MKKSAEKLCRRDLFKGMFRNITNIAVESLERSQPRLRPRPPGALTETIFLATCTRCGKCSQICPAGCIRPYDDPSKGYVLGTPYVDFTRKGCSFCMQCVANCPTGALSANSENEYRIGTAHISESACIAWKGAICGNCGFACKRQAIISDQNRRPKVQANLCNGCGICQSRCIASPNAIIIDDVIHDV